MNAPRPLAGKVALVTGASRGIGRSVAIALADSGADLVLTSTGQTDAADEVRTRGQRAIHLAADVADRSQADRVVAAALEAFGKIDVLVNNAGVVVRAPIHQMEDADFDRVLAVNLSGPFYLARRLVPPMVARGWGRVLNISSISSTMGSPSLTAYCASKWGLNGFTRALAEELTGTGVLVAAVLPGSVDTDMLKGSGFPPRLAPVDVAGVVRYLCVEAPLAMNGSLVEVFG